MQATYVNSLNHTRRTCFFLQNDKYCVLPLEVTRGGLGVSDSRAWTVIGDTQIHPGGITMTHQGGARGHGAI